LFKTYLNLSWESDSFWSTIPVLLLLQLTLLPIKIPLVYTCFYVIDNYLLGKWREWQSASALVLAFAIGIVGMTLVNHLVILPYILKVDSSAVPIFHIDSLFYHLFTLCFVGGAAVSIRLLRRQYQSRLREVELQKEKTETELKYLKSQINPHFLFNTLNNIYSLARKGSEQTPESVLKLSKLMRFMLYDASNPVVLLTDELRLIIFHWRNFDTRRGLLLRTMNRLMTQAKRLPHSC
jgi:two-component system LytT family sensor kinase